MYFLRSLVYYGSLWFLWSPLLKHVKNSWKEAGEETEKEELKFLEEELEQARAEGDGYEIKRLEDEIKRLKAEIKGDDKPGVMDRMKDYAKGTKRLEENLAGDKVLELDVEEQMSTPDFASDGIHAVLAGQVRQLLEESGKPELGRMKTEVRINREQLIITQVPMVQVKYTHESDAGKKHYELWIHRKTGAVEAADSPIAEYRTAKGLAKSVLKKLNPFQASPKRQKRRRVEPDYLERSGLLFSHGDTQWCVLRRASARAVRFLLCVLKHPLDKISRRNFHPAHAFYACCIIQPFAAL